MPTTSPSAQMGVSPGSQSVSDASGGPAPYSSYLRSSLVSYLQDRQGVTAIEYGILVALMTLVIISSISNLGGTVLTQLFSKVAASM
jgi:Flp pilus assembly pilin Flp